MYDKEDRVILHVYCIEISGITGIMNATPELA